MDWACPVCRETTNSVGIKLASKWAVACHIAGKAISGDFSHARWLRRVFPGVEEVKNPTIPYVARIIEAYVARVISDPNLDIGSERPSGPTTPYDSLRRIEERLHAFIRDVLVVSFGSSNEAWWREGIPLPVRQKCVERREEDIKPQDAYSYVDLIDLKEILDKRWNLSEPRVNPSRAWFKQKTDWMTGLVTLNELRKRIMHPARRYQVVDEDNAVLRQFDEALEALVEMQMREFMERTR